MFVSTCFACVVFVCENCALLVHVAHAPTSARCFWSRSPPVLCCERLKTGFRRGGSVQALVCVRMSVGSMLTLL